MILTICAVAALTLAALVGTAAGRGGATIKVGDDFFSPTEKSVPKDTKVKFNWIGTDEHNVVKKRGPGGDFSSGVLEGSGVLYKHKFKKKGDYKIICTLHEEMKMKLHVN